nr:MAG TPA: hypothetical protein [Caudoviricetes sp.]
MVRKTQKGTIIIMLEQFKALAYRTARTLIGGAPHMSSDQVAEALRSGQFGYLIDTRSHDILRMADAMAYAYNRSAQRYTTHTFTEWVMQSPKAAELLRLYRIRAFIMGHYGDPRHTGFGRVYSMPALPLTPAEVGVPPQAMVVEHAATTIPLEDQAMLPLGTTTIDWTVDDCAFAPRGLIQRIHDSIMSAMQAGGCTPLWGPSDTDHQTPVIYGTLA